MAIISISDSQVNGADQILVADGSSKIPAVDGSQITILNASNVATGTIASARLDTGTTANKLVLLDGSGNLPAVDASLLTGIVSATISASDPTISTNPSGGVGTEWNNSTSGEMYICTDATAGANVWTNVGAGSGNIDPYAFQGTQYGYTAGGSNGPTTTWNIISKFSFTTNANSTDVGDLTATSQYTAGMHSNTHGYSAGSSTSNFINKYSFTTDGNATDVGDFTTQISAPGAMTSQLNGYTTGGWDFGPPAVNSNKIQRVSFSSDGNAVDVADMSEAKLQSSGSTDTINGYAMCGSAGASDKTTVEKFPYATEANSTDIGDMTFAGGSTGGASSLTHGYVFGRYNNAGNSKHDIIDKFNFSGTFTATDVGDISHGVRHATSGHSSTTYGYYAGGTNNAAWYTDIGRVAFASDGNSTDVADLYAIQQYHSGTSY